jgi:hypothetical protein
VSSGTSKPAPAAIQAADRPTTSALSFVPLSPNMNRSSSRFCSGVATWACNRANWASASSATASSRTTACSDAQIMPLSKVLDTTMSWTARTTSAVPSMYAGTLPGPTPRAGLPAEYAAWTIALPPVARMTDTPG